MGLGADHGIALRVWLMMVFFSTALLFFITKFNDLFDAYTFNNLDRLITYAAVLTGITSGVTASIDAIGKPSDRRVSHWLWAALLVAIVALIVIYSVYLSKLPNITYYIPRSLPEAVFMFIMFSLSGFLCITLGRVYLAYLPQETSPIMRTRAILIIVSMFIGCGYFLIKILTVGGYFWIPLASQNLINLSLALLVVSAISHFSGLLSNKVYIRFVMASRSIKNWRTFRDLKYLMGRLLLVCPDLKPPIIDPSFWKFLSNPEYYLYRAVIAIMDGKTILDDLLSEGALSGEPALWERDKAREVVRVERVLQSINPSGNFWELVNEYRHASRSLSRGQDRNPAWEIGINGNS